MDLDRNKKITMRQIIIIFLVGIASPIIRVIPKYSSQIAEGGAILVPLVSIIPLIVLLYILNHIFKRSGKDSLDEVFDKIFGKAIGKVLCIVYIFWCILLMSLYLRYLAERFTSTILIFTPIQFFILTMLLIVYLASRNEIKYFARYVEVFAIIFVVVISVTFFVSIPNIKITNILPVTINQTLPIIYATYPLLAIWAYVTFIFFLGDKISDKGEFKKYFRMIYITLLTASTAVILVTVGIFGCKLNNVLNMPFFIFFKNIKFLTVIERIESILISLWTATDFAIITFFMFVAIKLMKKTFKLKSERICVNPICGFIYVFSQYMASNEFELNAASSKIFIHVNVFLGFIIPIIVLVVGKIRKQL